MFGYGLSGFIEEITGRLQYFSGLFKFLTMYGTNSLAAMTNYFPT